MTPGKRRRRIIPAAVMTAVMAAAAVSTAASAPTEVAVTDAERRHEMYPWLPLPAPAEEVAPTDVTAVMAQRLPGIRANETVTEAVFEVPAIPAEAEAVDLARALPPVDLPLDVAPGVETNQAVGAVTSAVLDRTCSVASQYLPSDGESRVATPVRDEDGKITEATRTNDVLADVTYVAQAYAHARITTGGYVRVNSGPYADLIVPNEDVELIAADVAGCGLPLRVFGSDTMRAAKLAHEFIANGFGIPMLAGYSNGADLADGVQVNFSQVDHLLHVQMRSDHVLSVRQLRTLTEAAKLWPDHVVVDLRDNMDQRLCARQDNETHCSSVITAGMTLDRSFNSPPLNSCSAGAGFRGSSGDAYTTTSGHCGNGYWSWDFYDAAANQTYEWTVGNTSRNYLDPRSNVTPVDFQIIKNTNDDTHGRTYIKYALSNSAQRYLGESSEFWPANGATVCKYGSVSGRQCGKVINQYISSFTDPPLIYELFRSTEQVYTPETVTDITGLQLGDSGGPVILNSNGQDHIGYGTVTGDTDFYSPTFYSPTADGVMVFSPYAARTLGGSATGDSAHERSQNYLTQCTINGVNSGRTQDYEHTTSIDAYKNRLLGVQPFLIRVITRRLIQKAVGK